MLRRLLISFIKVTRPLLGGFGACRYAFTCTDFAQYQLQEKPFIQAIAAILRRVLSCHPFW